MTFYERLLMGCAPFCFNEAGDGGDAGGGSGGEGGDDNADAGDNGGDDGQGNDGNEGGADGKDNKSGDSLLDGLDDGDGVTFDFTTGEKPEGFPDDYWDAENGSVNAQALFDGLKKQEKIAKDLRAKMGKGEHKAPEKAEDYKLDLPEELQELVPADDPAVAKARERALAHGMSQEQFQGFMGEIIGDLAEIAQEAAENGGMSEEQKAEYVKEEIAKIGPNGPQVLRAVQSWGNELLAEGTFNEQDVETLKSEGLVSANMVALFNRLRARMGGSDIPMDGFDDGLPPDSEIAEKLNSMAEKAKETGNHQEYMNYEAKIMEKRQKAGRPQLLQF
ncbi:MAG: capsid assembly protein [Candidatus Puniceispirillaceae bacterium]